ncbi:hypothetical protein quinque_006112 [Culex quinquefasciatus]
MEVGDVVEWLSAILVTLVIRISWSLRQTMATLEEQNTSNSRYYSARNDLDVTHQENDAPNMESVSKTPQLAKSSTEVEKSVVTSTPLGKGVLAEQMVSPNLSDIIESPRDFAHKEPTPEGLRYERNLVDQFCMMRMPTEADGEIIRTTFARGKISPETEIKYRKFLAAPVARPRLPQRKHLRLFIHSTHESF